MTDYSVRKCQKCSEHYYLNEKSKSDSSQCCPYCDSYAIADYEDDFVIKKNKLIKYTGKAKNVIIPDKITAICKNAFAYNDKIEYVSMPDTVTEIEHGAFLFCTNLRYVNFSDSLVNIGSSSFAYCKSMFAVILPDSVQKIDECAFSDCYTLNSIVLGKNIKTIARGALRNCKELISAHIPDSLNSIESDVFSGCKSLKAVRLPDSVTNIPDNMFYECEQLKSVNLPDTINKIGSYAFKGCKSLLDICVVSDSDIVFRKGSFMDCSSLKCVTVKSRAIPSYCFYNCTNLVAVQIDGARSIEENAFANCKKMSYISFGDKLERLGNLAFSNCVSLNGSFVLPDSLFELSVTAFDNCKSLTSIVAPLHLEGVEEIIEARFNLDNKTNNNDIFSFDESSAENLDASENIDENIEAVIDNNDETDDIYAFTASSDAINVDDIDTSIHNEINTDTAKNENAAYDEDINANIDLKDAENSNDELLYDDEFEKLNIDLQEENDTEQLIRNIADNVIIESKISPELQSILLDSIRSQEYNDDIKADEENLSNGQTEKKSEEIISESSNEQSNNTDNADTTENIKSTNKGIETDNKFCDIFSFDNDNKADNQIKENEIEDILKSNEISEELNEKKDEYELFYNSCNSSDCGSCSDSSSEIKENTDISDNDKSSFEANDNISIEKSDNSEENSSQADSVDNVKNLEEIDSDELFERFVKSPNSEVERDNQNESYELRDEALYTDDENISLLYGANSKPEEFEINNDTLLAYNGTAENIIIPEGVVKIAKHAFSGRMIKSVSFPDSVKEIGEFAFSYCIKLEEVLFGEGLIEIMPNAFYNCSSIETLRFPYSLRIIGNQAFAYCSSLLEVEFSEKIEEINSLAFFACSNLLLARVPSNIKICANDAFFCCSNLREY